MFDLAAGGGDARDGGVGALELARFDLTVRQLEAPVAGHGQVPGVVRAKLVRGHRRGLRQRQGQRRGEDAPGVLSEGGKRPRKQERGGKQTREEFHTWERGEAKLRREAVARVI